MSRVAVHYQEERRIYLKARHEAIQHKVENGYDTTLPEF